MRFIVMPLGIVGKNLHLIINERLCNVT